MKKETLNTILKGMGMIQEALLRELENMSEDLVTNVIDIKEKMVKQDNTIEPKLVEGSVKEVEENKEVSVESLNMDDLNSKTLLELKDLAKSLGLTVRGSKSALIGRILEAQDVNVNEVVEPKEDVLEEVDNQVEDVEIEGVEDLEVEEDLETQLSEYTIEELAEILTSIGVSAKGKKQSLIAKVVKSVEDGLISFEEDEVENEESSEESTEVGEEVINPEIEDDIVEPEEVEDDTIEDEGIDVTDVLETLGMRELKTICKELGIKVKLSDKKPKLIGMINEYEDDEKLINVLVAMEVVDLSDAEDEVIEDVVEDDTTEAFTVEGSETRIKVVEDNFTNLQEAYEKGETTLDEVTEFLGDYYTNNKSELKKIEAMSEEDKVSLFCWLQANLVDDDGEEVDFNEPYMVGDKPYCCGQPMKQLNDTTYLCEVDGEEVTLEEE